MYTKQDIEAFKQAIVPSYNLNRIPAILKTREFWGSNGKPRIPFGDRVVEGISPIFFGSKRSLPMIRKDRLEEFWDELLRVHGTTKTEIATTYIHTYMDMGCSFAFHKQLMHLMYILDNKIEVCLIPAKVCSLINFLMEAKYNGSFIISDVGQYPEKVDGFSVFTRDMFNLTMKSKIKSNQKKAYEKKGSIDDMDALEYDDGLFDLLCSLGLITNVSKEWYGFSDIVSTELDMIKIIDEQKSNSLSYNSDIISISPSKSQQKAISNSVSTDKKACGVCGEAGSGKTTTAKSIANHFGRNNLYLAPTGKASVVLKENGCSPAMTISLAAKKAEKAKNGYNCCIIDESSMINTTFMQDLKDVFTKAKFDKYIFMGDIYQCQPIGSGAFFSDLIRYRSDRFIELTEQHRCDDSTYIASTHSIRNNMFYDITNIPEYKYESFNLRGDDSKRQIRCNSFRDVLNGLYKKRQQYLTDKTSTILTHKNEDALYISFVLAMSEYPTEIQEFLKHHGSAFNATDKDSIKKASDLVSKVIDTPVNGMDSLKLTIKDRGYYFILGHKVMLTRNVYRGPNTHDSSHGIKNTMDIEDMLANGQVFNVTSIDRVNGYATLDDKYVVDLRTHSFIPATCITVHKSQGSTYNAVAYVHLTHNTTGSILYTALTRTKKCMDIFYLPTFGNNGYLAYKKECRRLSSISVKNI